jgi:hypothetical protein
MTLRGHLQHGTIVLDQPPDLPDGTTVQVEITPVEPSPRAKPGIAESTEGIDYDFDAFDRLREASRL